MGHTFPHFEIAIQQQGDLLTVKVLRATVGGPVGPLPLVLPFPLHALPRWREDAADWVIKASTARLRTSGEVIRKTCDFGTALFLAIFKDDLLTRFRQNREHVPPDARLRVLLHVPPSLALVPWEMLYDPDRQSYLSLAPDLSLARYTASGSLQPGQRSAVVGPVRMLVVLASPTAPKYERLNVQRELTRIKAAFQPMLRDGLVVLDVVEGRSTIEKLRLSLKQPVHIVHFFCHGDLDYDNSGEGVLVFEDQDGAPELMSASLLRNYIQQQRRNIRLVVVNACLGALPVGDDHFSSIGSALMHGGVPAVVAMQFELTVDAAEEFTRIFYAELADGAPIDAALAQTRLHMNGKFPARLDWTVPVLFMRTSDLMVFQLGLGEPDKPSPPRNTIPDTQPSPSTQAPSRPADPNEHLIALEVAGKSGALAEADRAGLGGMVENPTLSIDLRLRAAHLASRTGDRRAGVCTDMPAWMAAFPEGVYQLAADLPDARVGLPTFQIARYTVTVWQYRRFITAGGYTTRHYWTANGWKHRHERSLVEPDDWPNLDDLALNRPVVGVCWYEAAAFCVWLTEQGRQTGWLEDHEVVRLPSEAEWTVAATVNPGAFTPLLEALAVGSLPAYHTSEYGLGRPAPVGVFIEGQSPCGAVDMAGNVWEWCSTLFDPALTPLPGDERLDFAPIADHLVVRGGSYGQRSQMVGYLVRARHMPISRDRFKGFRLVKARSRSA